MTHFAAILLCGLFLAACASDPMRDVPRLTDANVDTAIPQVSIRETPAEQPVSKGGFFSRLLAGQAGRSQSEVGVREVDTPEVLEIEEDPTVVAEPPEKPRRGLLGFLRRAADDVKREDAGETEVAPTQAAALSSGALPVSPSQNGLAEPKKLPSGPKPGAPDYRVVSQGTVLPFGELARLCGVPARKLGKRIERYPERGGIYALYDSKPGDTGLRNFYLTGFEDGCARQFTAALAIFGSPQMHELLRYGLPDKVQPFSDTDAAYEKVKSNVCKVRRGKPCGSAMGQLSENTVFVSVYERFGSNENWKTVLLHDGSVVEADLRGN